MLTNLNMNYVQKLVQQIMSFTHLDQLKLQFSSSQVNFDVRAEPGGSQVDNVSFSSTK